MDEQRILTFLNGLDRQTIYALQVAALLADTFSLDYVLEIANVKPSKLLMSLDELVEQGIIKEKSGSDRGTYLFTNKRAPHIILQSMEEEKRRSCLSNIIDHLERNLPNNNKKSLTLAGLYTQLSNHQNSFQCLKKAADLLVSAHRSEDALKLYVRVINGLLAKDRDSLESVVLIESIISYAPIAINFYTPKSIFPMIDKARSLADDLHNDRAKAILELCLARLYQCQGNSIEASAHYDEGWRLAQAKGNISLLKSASKLFALSLFWQGRMNDAINMYESTLGNVEEISPDLRDLWAYLMLAYCYGKTGHIARGVGLAEAIRARAISKKYLKAQAFAHAVIALILMEARQLEDAKPHVTKALAIGERIGSDLALWMSKPCRAYEFCLKGNLPNARNQLDSAMNHSKILGQKHHPSPLFIEVLWSFHKAKYPTKGYSFVSELNRSLNWPDIYMKGVALRYQALAKQTSGANVKEIEQLLEKSEKLLRESGARTELGRTQAELARLLVRKKDKIQATKIANSAYQILSTVDSSLFPSGLLPLIKKRHKESSILIGLQEISQLSGAITFQQGHNNYLGKIVTILTDMFGAERTAIFIKQDGDQNDSLEITATRNFSPEELEQINKGALQNVISSTIERKESLIIADVKMNQNVSQLVTTDSPIKSVMCIPLLAGGKILGLIYSDNRFLKGIFTKKDLAVMSAIAAQVSLFLKTATLSREVDDYSSADKEESNYPGQTEFQPGLPQIIGKSKAIRNVLSKAIKVSETDATALILGETGVGKELIAQTIHKSSNRADKPFITVNVSALTENLLTSELFGHEKGAFTNAEKTKIGRFEIASQGTIFLDEIGDLSTEAQVKLLRVLQEGEFERVGGTQVIHSDFRLIAATNRNLIEMVTKGDFRSDLFYRINTFPIEIPPLRERKEDIPDLMMHFLKRYARKYRKKVKKIPGNEIKKLVAYPWPGNIRELEHIIERALILSANETLSIPDFGEPHPIAPEKEARSETELLPLDEIERRHITNVLDHVRWRIRGERGAAKILELKPSTLEFRMKKLGIKR